MKYIIYAVGEICLVAIGLLIALQVDNWDKEQDNRSFERQYYLSMQAQLIKDKQSLLTESINTSRLIKKFNHAISIIENNDREQIEQLGALVLELKNYADFRRKSSVFQTLINSGEIKHIRNTEIVAAFQDLEGRYNFIERLEATHQQAVINVVADLLIDVVQFQPIKVQKPEMLYGYVIKNAFVLMQGLNYETGALYEDTALHIDATLELINQELGADSRH